MVNLNRRNFCKSYGEGVGENIKCCCGHNFKTKLKPIPNHHPCECGCGELVASNRKYINHHNPSWNKGLGIYRSFPQPCNCGCGNITNEGSKYLPGHHKARLGTGKYKTSSQLCQCGCGKMTRPGCNFFGKHKKGMKHSPLSEKHKLNLSHQRSKEGKEANKIAQNTILAKENHRNAMLKRYQNPEERQSQSKAIIKFWADPERRKSQLLAIGKGLCKLPNNPETLINLITQEYFNGWQYIGDYSEIINGKNPDFINEETKQIIEMYGDYWHDGEDPTDRAEIFASAGYETCVIWENELSNLDKVIWKMKLFCGVEG